MITEWNQFDSATELAEVANDGFARTFPESDAALPPEPAQRLAVVTCMDARLDPYRMLGLTPGDAHVIRNAGGIVTDDVIRSLILSHHALGTREVMVINHTCCGLLNLNDQKFRQQLTELTGRDAEDLHTFHGFADLERNVREQVQRVTDHPWLSQRLAVTGYTYDVKTGRLGRVPVDADTEEPVSS